MRIAPEEFDEMRRWFAVVAPEVVPAGLLASSAADPVAILDHMAAKAPAKARDGLAMAISDIVEMTQLWPPEKVGALDDSLRTGGLPTLTEIRVRFSKAVNRALRRGLIKDDTEYHAVRNAAEMSRRARPSCGRWSPPMRNAQSRVRSWSGPAGLRVEIGSDVSASHPLRAFYPSRLGASA